MPEVHCAHIDPVIWEAATSDTFSLNNSVHVWRIHISLNLELLSFFSSALREEELKEVLALSNDADRRQFIISRGALRILLAQYLRLAPLAIKLETDINKKPFILTENETPLQYNISHSGDVVLIAIAGQPTGIDVEEFKNDLNYKEVLPLHFSIPERYFINNSEIPVSHFYRLWTRKEALVKGTGKGIDNDLALIPCLDGDHKTTAEVINSDKDWSVSSFEPAKGYAGSIAYQSGVPNVSFIEAGDFFEIIKDQLT